MRIATDDTFTRAECEALMLETARRVREQMGRAITAKITAEFYDEKLDAIANQVLRDTRLPPRRTKDS